MDENFRTIKCNFVKRLLGYGERYIRIYLSDDKLISTYNELFMPEVVLNKLENDGGICLHEKRAQTGVDTDFACKSGHKTDTSESRYEQSAEIQKQKGDGRRYPDCLSGQKARKLTRHGVKFSAESSPVSSNRSRQNVIQANTRTTQTEFQECMSPAVSGDELNINICPRNKSTNQRHICGEITPIDPENTTKSVNCRSEFPDNRPCLKESRNSLNENNLGISRGHAEDSDKESNFCKKEHGDLQRDPDEEAGKPIGSDQANIKHTETNIQCNSIENSKEQQIQVVQQGAELASENEGFDEPAADYSTKEYNSSARDDKDVLLRTSTRCDHSSVETLRTQHCQSLVESEEHETTNNCVKEYGNGWAEPKPAGCLADKPVVGTGSREGYVNTNSPKCGEEGSIGIQLKTKLETANEYITCQRQNGGKINDVLGDSFKREVAPSDNKNNKDLECLEILPECGNSEETKNISKPSEGKKGASCTGSVGNHDCDREASYDHDTTTSLDVSDGDQANGRKSEQMIIKTDKPVAKCVRKRRRSRRPSMVNTGTNPLYWHEMMNNNGLDLNANRHMVHPNKEGIRHNVYLSTTMRDMMTKIVHPGRQYSDSFYGGRPQLWEQHRAGTNSGIPRASLPVDKSAPGYLVREQAGNRPVPEYSDKFRYQQANLQKCCPSDMREVMYVQGQHNPAQCPLVDLQHFTNQYYLEQGHRHNYSQIRDMQGGSKTIRDDPQLSDIARSVCCHKRPMQQGYAEKDFPHEENSNACHSWSGTFQKCSSWTMTQRADPELVFPGWDQRNRSTNCMPRLPQGYHPGGTFNVQGNEDNFAAGMPMPISIPSRPDEMEYSAAAVTRQTECQGSLLCSGRVRQPGLHTDCNLPQKGTENMLTLPNANPASGSSLHSVGCPEEWLPTHCDQYSATPYKDDRAGTNWEINARLTAPKICQQSTAMGRGYHTSSVATSAQYNQIHVADRDSISAAQIYRESDQTNSALIQNKQVCPISTWQQNKARQINNRPHQICTSQQYVDIILTSTMTGAKKDDTRKRKRVSTSEYAENRTKLPKMPAEEGNRCAKGTPGQTNRDVNKRCLAECSDEYLCEVDGSSGLSTDSKDEVLVITCANCDKAAVYLCSGCRSLAFCSRTCQELSWKSHKDRCLQKKKLLLGY